MLLLNLESVRQVDRVVVVDTQHSELVAGQGAEVKDHRVELNGNGSSCGLGVWEGKS